MTCRFVPPYLLSRIAASHDLAAASHCHRTLAIDASFRADRSAHRDALAAGTGAPPGLPAGAGLAWTVHDAAHTAQLPGAPVRSEGDPPVGDPAADEAWAGIEASLAMFAEVYGHRSYDGAGAQVSATVHYERDYANAFWDGANLVFGDGDGEVFTRFTRAVDVLAHELVHAVTERTAGLVYRDQPGALNESVSDVFAACLKQRLLGQDATEGDWLVGEGIFLPRVQGRALRSMSAPGTAYDDPLLGRDPQPAHMSGFVVTHDDNGGVHLNSGIPNRAFHLAATAIGGSAAQGAGRIWWQALGTVTPTVDFAGFAAATVAAAGPHAGAVRDAWHEVGVDPGTASPVPAGEAPPTGEELEVRRSGGLLGRTVAARVDLAGDDPRAPEARDLLARVDLHAVRPGTPRPDAYVYAFTTHGETVQVAEGELTDDLRRLAHLMLDDGA